MMDNPTDTTLDRLFGTTLAAPKLVVQNEIPPPAAPDKDHEAALAELMAEAAEPDHYRPYLTKPRPLVAFVLVEKDGTMHGFQNHTVRHPTFQRQGGSDFLSFSADGLAVVIEGRGLAPIFRALVRHCLAEVREYDGRPGGENVTHVSRLAVKDPRAEAV